jgi:hypothetical protein
MEFESGYFETVDQKIFIGWNALLRLTKEKFHYSFICLLYLLFAIPLVTILRRMPIFNSENGNNGLLVLVENKKK